jgi:ubiquitin thioesterase protein OTUB1
LLEAVVFGYFEILLSQGLDKVAAERVRLQSFNDTLVGVGYDFTMVELFVDETLGLFDSLQQAVASGNRSDQLLLDIFNDETRSNSIIFHFKVRVQIGVRKKILYSNIRQLMTSATMKSNPDQYQPYLEQPLFEYCRSNIDAFGQEIEQISLQALTDGVIAPANMNVIVMYLDRSEGNEVTPHHLVANASPDWPTITLLYRP